MWQITELVWQSSAQLSSGLQVGLLLQTHSHEARLIIFNLIWCEILYCNGLGLLMVFVSNTHAFLDPVTTSTYILGARNVTQIATLNQPSTLRCLAGGYPKPSVSWWKGQVMLPFESEQYRFGIDYSMRITRVGLSDLGEYTCQAYSTSGKPTASIVVLKAYGPVHTTSPYDREYLKYIITSPEVPTTPRPDPRYPYRPTRPPPRIIPSPVVNVNLSKYFRFGLICSFS